MPGGELKFTMEVVPTERLPGNCLPSLSSDHSFHSWELRQN